jgi:isoleucyl-tRNA synthetase
MVRAHPETAASKGDYAATLNLPQTPFPLKGELPKREPEMLGQWGGLYEKLSKGRDGKTAFVLHDGPPYANGAIHIGHALNKILKDMVIRSRALMGHKISYRPGWDCHGLPIETALLKEKKSGPRGITDVVQFRHEAADFAERWISLQGEDFKRLGVLGDWENPYKTMSRDYESATLRAFRLLLEKGFVYRGLKPVLWCVHCETALAEAEVEYKEKRSPSVYVAFPFARAPRGLEGAELLIWTTTPWTLPANRGVAVHPDLRYTLLGQGSRRFVVAEKKADEVAKIIGASRLGGAWSGLELSGGGLQPNQSHEYRRPFASDGQRMGKVVPAEYVTVEDGTGLVHTAPGHGADDFQTGLSWGLNDDPKTLCPVDASGRFAEAAPEFLRGLRVFPEGNEAVAADLTARGLLLAREEISHSYPHCWRCKNPVIFRASEQWFMSVEKKDLRGRVLAEIDKVRWVPAASRARIASMVGSRPDWCLSRQRLWGTPIPILYCAACGTWLKDDGVLKAVEEKVARDGSDFWFAHRGAEVTPEDWDFLPRGTSCPSCGERRFRRETDILDVWLDSGVSWLSVLAGGGLPCDLYLEGSDQHRGWFQSSLLSSCAINGTPPYRAVLTHGFVLDENGRAMHKSLGNVVSPQEVISQYGADVLRLWVALSDWSDDVRLSANLLKGVVDAYRRVRNTLRYLLGNLHDYVPDAAGEPAAGLPEMENYVLARLGELEERVLEDYRNFGFRSAARRLVDFCAFDLSAFYFDVLKDRLYTYPRNHPLRRAAQRTLAEILRSLLPLLSPILPFTAEEAWGHKPREWGWGERAALACLPARREGAAEAPSRQPTEPPSRERWEKIFELRAAAHKALEEARSGGVLGGSLEAKIVLRNVPPRALEGEALDWAEMFIVSEARLQGGTGALEVEILKADGRKCARCWRYQKDVGSDPRHEDICGRCATAVASA